MEGGDLDWENNDVVMGIGQQGKESIDKEDNKDKQILIIIYKLRMPKARTKNY